jgi:hypothetical protein
MEINFILHLAHPVEMTLTATLDSLEQRSRLFAIIEYRQPVAAAEIGANATWVRNPRCGRAPHFASEAR